MADIAYPDTALPPGLTAQLKAHVQLNRHGQAVAVTVQAPDGLPEAFSSSAQEGLMAADYFAWTGALISPREGVCATVEFIEDGVKVRIRWDLRIQASRAAVCLAGK